MEWSYESFRDKYVSPWCEKAVPLEKFSCEPHLHHNIEFLYVWDGCLELHLFNLNELIEVVELHPGETIFVNCNIIHSTAYSVPTNYAVGFIPPNCLMSSLHISVGRTFTKPYKDEDGTVARVVEDIRRFANNIGGPVVRDVMLNSLGNSLAALLLPRLGTETLELRGSQVKSDILTYVYVNFKNPELTPDKIAKTFGYSRRSVENIFSESFSSGVKEFIDGLRINEAKNLLRNTRQSVESISTDVGYENVRTFFRVFGRMTGMPPGEYRKQIH